MKIVLFVTLLTPGGTKLFLEVCCLSTEEARAVGQTILYEGKTGKVISLQEPQKDENNELAMPRLSCDLSSYMSLLYR